MSRTHKFVPTTRRREEKKEIVIHKVALRRCRSKADEDENYDIKIRIHV